MSTGTTGTSTRPAQGDAKAVARSALHSKRPVDDDPLPDAVLAAKEAEAERAQEMSAQAPTASTTRPATEDETPTKRSRLKSPVSRVQVKAASDGIRNRLGAAVWIVAVLCALVLAAAALVIALDANRDNSVVEWLIARARELDGPFGSLFSFDGDGALKKTRLVNWGIAATAYLIAGKILERIIKA